MRTFQDKTGRSWSLDLTIGTVLRVKSASDGLFDLFDGQNDDLLNRLWTDFEQFWRCLWHVIEPQAQAAEPPITAAEFGEAMAAPELVAARQAFFAEWSDFFRGLQRPDQALPLEKMTEYTATALEAIRAKATEIQAADRLAKQRIESTLNNSFGKLLAELELPTQGPSPSGSCGGSPPEDGAPSSIRPPLFGR